MDFIIDVETAPFKFGKHTYIDDETREEKDKGAFSPITGRITAAGWKTENEEKVFLHQSSADG